MSTPRIPVQPVVHVGGPGVECMVAIVMAPGHVSRVRILVPSRGTVGAADEEGDVRYFRDPVWVPNPDGSQRLLTSWHYVDQCAVPIDWPVQP